MASNTVPVCVLLLSSLLVITCSPLISLPVDGTACDWNVWDDTAEEKIIQKISIHCSEGQVTWRTPFGGLALDFLPLLKSQHYELCFIARSSFATLQLFLEGNQTLTRLAALNNSKVSRTREICLRSAGAEPIVIFIETDSSSSSPVYGKMVFEYDIQVMPQSNISQMQECRPCTDEETILAVCTADYAAFGEIHSIIKNKESGLTELNVITNHVIRQRYEVAKNLFGVQNKRVQENLVRHFIKHSYKRHKRSLTDSMPVLDKGKTAGYHLSIIIPDKCQIKHGGGIFLFLGNIRLKRARLGCAPRLEEFRQIWSSALSTGSNQCIL